MCSRVHSLLAQTHSLALDHRLHPCAQSAAVGSLTQFTIIACDAEGGRVEKGGDDFQVIMRGKACAESQPALVRTKLTDRGNGTYMCEYRPWLTGSFEVHVTLDSCSISGSPHPLSVVTLRPDASKCVVRGDALHKAVSRAPAKFEILFIDALGKPAQAEEVDVFVEEEGTSEAGDGQATGGPPGRSGRDNTRTARNGSRSPGRSRSPRARSTRNFRRDSDGENHYTMLDAPTRQRHLQLWASRQAADRLLARQNAESAAAQTHGDGETKKKRAAVYTARTSFAHELSVDPFGFAFGGVDPGTLHAHGKLVKVHSVHYSVGLARKYKLHVGLRQQERSLPGSPFELTVEPGVAYAASSKLPEESLPLQGTADEEWQKGLVFSTADVLGNVCIRGGANVTMKLAKAEGGRDGRRAAPSGTGGEGNSSHDDAEVECKVEDREDGSYELLWKCNRAGSFPIDVMINGVHVINSPMKLSVFPARPAPERFVVNGAGLVKAVAGTEAMLRIRVADRFDNTITPAGEFPFTFGILLLPSRGDKGDADIILRDKKMKTPGGDKKGSESGAGQKKGRDDERTSPSRNYVGAWVGSSYEIAYVPEEAGMTDLHLWCTHKETSVEAMTGAQGGQGDQEDPAAPGPSGQPTREPLPGSAFTVHVSEGNASATGSFVKDAEAKQAGAGAGTAQGGFVAGEHIVIRPQVRDPFGNASTAPESALTAEHDLPGDDMPIELEPPKMRGGIGSYELSVEPTRAGVHVIHIKLHGEEISGSPVSFKVTPGPPSVAKCYLTKPKEQAIEKVPYGIVATLVDKYGNKLDRGGVRVDAKALGAAATSSVEDRKDGTYMISITAGAPGEVKLSVRIDSVELTPTISWTVIRSVEEKHPSLDAASDPPAADRAPTPTDDLSESLAPAPSIEIDEVSAAPLARANRRKSNDRSSEEVLAELVSGEETE
jgi:hypothetical protein